MPAPAEEQMQEMMGEGEGEGKGKGKGKGDGKGKGKGKMMMKGKGKGKGKMMKGKGKGKMMGPPGGGGAIAPAGGQQVVYQRKSRNAGQVTIEMYCPQFYFDQVEMEEYDARPDRFGPSVIGKYTKGIGQVEGRFPTDDEDPISFAMTVIHRLVERMEDRGINETGKYQPEGTPLNLWNAFGRLDVGTESITDRSKSMKSYCMDLFERYGNGESNIEGVDQYNACYGGQACGLCTLSWVESDRWDGRYGIACATDISEAHPMFMAFAGAACTATCFFADAPVPHHSQRASAILHRFDFFKPVGWHDMAPVTDGKYSVECYLEALDAAYASLRKKVNGRELLNMTDFNVFHTGGGYHIVRKAFERLVRNERPDCRGAEKEALVDVKLHPSVSLLKIIGPCHTVSSFLNTGSVYMNKMEQGLGKVIMVYTYGSGCASSMYQMRVDDLPYMDPMEVWKNKFYAKAIKMPCELTTIHIDYVETWMKFAYMPRGRKKFGIPTWKYEDNAYYLLEIDQWGRRFYHRGGLKTGPLDKKFHAGMLHEKAEARKKRKDYGPIPEDAREPEKIATQDQIWQEIEYDLRFTEEEKEANLKTIADVDDRYNVGQRRIVKEDVMEHRQYFGLGDGQAHVYAIIGTWNKREPQEMTRNPDGSFTFAFTLGENRFERFHLWQDFQWFQKIYPSEANAGKTAPCVGPHHGGAGPLKEWLIDCRDRVDVPEDQAGMPGDKYLITFRHDYGKMKNLTWDKLEGEQGDIPVGQYYLCGSWTDYEPVEIPQDESAGAGYYSTEVQVTSLGIEFDIQRNADPEQVIYPLVKTNMDLPVSVNTPVGGPDGAAHAFKWKIEDELGAIYKITYFRDPDDCEPSAMLVDWEKVGTRAVVEPDPTFYIIGEFNKWGALGMSKMASFDGGFKIFTGDVPLQDMVTDPNMPDRLKAAMTFKIISHKDPNRCVHPDKMDCTQLMAHKVLMSADHEGTCWMVGKQGSDKAKLGDTFTVRLEIKDDGSMAVSWAKKV